MRRIQFALCSLAYGDPVILARLAEATDDNIKRISQALINKAPHLASLKLDIAREARYPLDITPHLTAAVRKPQRSGTQSNRSQGSLRKRRCLKVRSLVQRLVLYCWSSTSARGEDSRTF